MLSIPCSAAIYKTNPMLTIIIHLNIERASKICPAVCKRWGFWTLNSGDGGTGKARHVTHLYIIFHTNYLCLTNQYLVRISVKVSFTPPCIVLLWACSVIGMAKQSYLESKLDVYESKECWLWSTFLHIFKCCARRVTNLTGTSRY